MIETELFNLIFVKNHFRMMISNLFNRKKKRSDPLCWWPSTTAVFWHFCDPVIAPPLLQRVLPVWDPNSCSVCPGMRPWNLPRGSLRSYYWDMNTFTFSFHGGSRVISRVISLYQGGPAHHMFVEASWMHQKAESKFTTSHPYLASSNLKMKSS